MSGFILFKFYIGVCTFNREFYYEIAIKWNHNEKLTNQQGKTLTFCYKMVVIYRLSCHIQDVTKQIFDSRMFKRVIINKIVRNGSYFKKSCPFGFDHF